jgi:serine-aspartate repeat-containing protein C/D/E
VRLYSGAGALLDTTTTDAGGLYSFTNLPPGDYFVEVLPPANYQFTLQDQDVDSDDSDANPGTGRTVTTTLVSGEDDPTWDAGLFRYASLGDYVWYDVNGDGVQDGSETGLVGIVVNLYDADTNVIDTTTTDSTGFYGFTNLVPGTYAIGVVAPDGYAFSPAGQGGDGALDSNVDPLTARTPFVTLVSGEHNPTIDAGLHVPATLGNYTWEDVNGNGRQDAGEPPMTNVTVTLYDTNAVPLLTTQTDASGLYLFTNLTPGAYYVGFTPPAGYQVTVRDAGADETDSDPDPLTGLTATTVLFSAEIDLTWDAGFYRPATLGDQVFEDLDYDSVQGPGEITPNVTGVVVNLYLSNGVFVASTTTGVSGVYLFTNLPPADYVVEFVAPRRLCHRRDPVRFGSRDRQRRRPGDGPHAGSSTWCRARMIARGMRGSRSSGPWATTCGGTSTTTASTMRTCRSTG